MYKNMAYEIVNKTKQIYLVIEIFIKIFLLRRKMKELVRVLNNI